MSSIASWCSQTFLLWRESNNCSKLVFGQEFLRVSIDKLLFTFLGTWNNRQIIQISKTKISSIVKIVVFVFSVAVSHFNY